MTVSIFQIAISLAAGIALIIILTTRFRIHAFFALVLAVLPGPGDANTFRRYN